MGGFSSITNGTTVDVFDVDADGTGGAQTFNLTCRTGAGSNSTSWVSGGTATIYFDSLNNQGVANLIRNLFLGDSRFTVGNSPTHTRRWEIINDNTNSNTLKIGTDTDTRVSILPSGRVGIGVTSPSNQLHVYDNRSGDYAALIDNDHGNQGHSSRRISSTQYFWFTVFLLR